MSSRKRKKWHFWTPKFETFSSGACPHTPPSLQYLRRYNHSFRAYTFKTKRYAPENVSCQEGSKCYIKSEKRRNKKDGKSNNYISTLNFKYSTPTDVLICINPRLFLQEKEEKPPESGAPYLETFGELSIRENLVMTSAYDRKLTVRTLRVKISTNEFLPSPLESFVSYCCERLWKWLTNQSLSTEQIFGGF